MLLFCLFCFFNRSPFLFNNRCQFCSELLLFVSFISSFPSLSFAYHPLHPPLSISPSLTRLSSETLLSIDGAVALCSLLQPLASPPPQPPKCLFVIGGRSPSRTWAAIESLGATRIFGKLSVPYLYFFADLRKGRGGGLGGWGGDRGDD